MSRQQRTRIKYIKMLLEPHEVRAVLDRLCMRYGFCLPPMEIERLATSPPTDIDEFTETALAAEGYGFCRTDTLCQQAREVVAQAFVDHQLLRPGDPGDPSEVVMSGSGVSGNWPGTGRPRSERRRLSTLRFSGLRFHL